MDRQRARDRAEAERRDSVVVRTKMFADAVRGTFAKMPSDPVEMNSYFDSIENLFARFEVPNDLKVALLRPYLSERAQTLLTRMDKAIVASYDDVKTYLLREFNLTPQVYLDKFNRVEKCADETNVLFVSRLKGLLDYYVKSRKVNDNYDK
jgi:hypothetical protein